LDSFIDQSVIALQLLHRAGAQLSENRSNCPLRLDGNCRGMVQRAAAAHTGVVHDQLDHRDHAHTEHARRIVFGHVMAPCN